MAASFTIHFVYGSTPKREYRKTEEKVPGGLLGGHIFIQAVDHIYGFEPFDRKRIHLFPKRKFNSIFTKERLSDWLPRNSDQKMVSIDIPVEQENLKRLNKILEAYHEETPYDYAVFGMRCGASTYQILGELGFLPPCGKFRAMMEVPYPGILRKKIVGIAEKQCFKIITQKGNKKRVWENG